MYRYDCEAGFYESDYYIGLMWEILKHRTWHLFTHGKWMDQERKMTWVFISYFVLLTIIYDLLRGMGWGLDMFWEILKFILGQEKIMDGEALNWLVEIGYWEIIEISLWVGLMYFGKCWIDDYFNRRLK